MSRRADPRPRDVPPEIVNATTAGAADAADRDRLVDALGRAGAIAPRLHGIGRATLWTKLAFHGLAER